MMQKGQSCSSCVHWYASLNQCRRHAPTSQLLPTQGVAAQLWPHTNPEQWCGDWRPERLTPAFIPYSEIDDLPKFAPGIIRVLDPPSAPRTVLMQIACGVVGGVAFGLCLLAVQWFVLR